MIKIITGDSAVFNFAIVYPGAVDGVPTPDLSQDTIKFGLKSKTTGKIIEKSVVGPDTNLVTFSFTPTETAALKQGVYEGCCKVYYGENATTVWMEDIMVAEGVLDA